jgi:hypothetical protein
LSVSSEDRPFVVVSSSRRFVLIGDPRLRSRQTLALRATTSGSCLVDPIASSGVAYPCCRRMAPTAFSVVSSTSVAQRCSQFHFACLTLPRARFDAAQRAGAFFARAKT